jgi:glycosyltransferase involved in cell wall biosynthesis
MRILIVVRNLQIGGVEQQAITLANTMAAMGIATHLLALKPRQQLTPDSAVNLHFHDLDRENRRHFGGLLYDLATRLLLAPWIPRSGFIWRGRYGARYFQQFVQQLEREHGAIDRIFVLGQGAFERIWPLKEDRIFQIVVDPLPPPSGSWREAIFMRCLLQQKQIIAVSAAIATTLSAMLTRHRITARALHTIHNPLPIDRIQALSREPFTPPVADYIVHVARLTRIKNQALLLHAYHQSALTIPLVIVGDGKERSRLARLCQQLGIAGRVHFVGYQANPYPWIAAARILVQSSHHEGFGLVLAEALACGTMCVSVDSPGGIREVLIEEQADYICANQPHALAAMLRYAIANPLTPKAGWYRRFDAPLIVSQLLAATAGEEPNTAAQRQSPGPPH